MSFLRRQIITSVLTANAHRPLPGYAPGAWAFFPGWLANELAPQALALTALDTSLNLLSRKRRSTLGLALAAVNMLGQAALVKNATGARVGTEQALVAGLGADYAETPATAEELATPWRQLAQPFRFSSPGVVVERNIAYGDAPKRRNLLDVYRPADHAALTSAPVLLQIHGGGWSTGEKEQQGRALMNRMAERGWVCVAPNYRLAPKNVWPAEIVDVKKAIAWVKENIADFGGDPDYIVITGGSAGGHLSSLAALTPNDPTYQPGFEEVDTTLAAAVPFYGVYDVAGLTGLKSARQMRDGFLAPVVFKKKFADDPEVFEHASPIKHVRPDSPDMFVVHGELDTLVDVKQARAFVAKLKEVSSNTVTYLELPGTQHAFEVFPSVRSEHVIRGVQRWLTWHERTHHKIPTGA